MITLQEQKYFSLEEIQEKLAEKGIYQKNKSTIQKFVSRNKTNKIRIGKTKAFYYPIEEVDKIVKYFILIKKRKMLNGMLKAISEEILELLN